MKPFDRQIRTSSDALWIRRQADLHQGGRDLQVTSRKGRLNGCDSNRLVPDIETCLLVDKFSDEIRLSGIGGKMERRDPAIDIVGHAGSGINEDGHRVVLPFPQRLDDLWSRNQQICQFRVFHRRREHSCLA